MRSLVRWSTMELLTIRVGSLKSSGIKSNYFCNGVGGTNKPLFYGSLIWIKHLWCTIKIWVRIPTIEPVINQKNKQRMKVAILQWCQKIDRGEGTIERISTTAKDCINYLAYQMSEMGYKSLVASPRGQHTLLHLETSSQQDTMYSLEEIKNFVQQQLDEDSFSRLYILCKGEDESDSHWWKIQTRNLY